MIIQPCFELPQSIELALMKGTMQRTGGVIQWAPGTEQAGQVVMWLRETSLQPLSPPQLATGGGLLGEALQFFGGVASILNLGATIAFGIPMMRKLGQVLKGLDEISSKLDRLTWTVECGTIAILGRLDGICLQQEAELWGKVRSAGKLAWQAQELEPGSSRRMQRLEHALAQATEASERLMLLVQNEISNAVNYLVATSGSYYRLRNSIEPSVQSSLMRLRQAMAVISLRASIQSETGSLRTNAIELANEYESLREATSCLGKAFFRGASEEVFCYDDLFAAEFKDVLPVSRIEHLATIFDPDVKKLSDIVELMRKHTGSRGIHSSISFDDATRNQLVSVLDSLEGAWEDLDRLSGYVAEYRTAAESGLSIYEYREALRLPDASIEQPICFFIPQELPTGSNVPSLP